MRISNTISSKILSCFGGSLYALKIHSKMVLNGKNGVGGSGVPKNIKGFNTH